MTRRSVLVLAGMSHDGYQGDPVIAHFAGRTAAFVRDVLGAADVVELAGRHHDAAGFTPFQVPDTAPGGRRVCYSGAGHILYQEALAAGFDAEFAALDDFFVRDPDNELAIAPAWRDVVADVDVVALSTSFVLKLPTLHRMLSLLDELGKTLVVGGVLVNKLSTARLASLPFAYCLKTEAEGRFSQILAAIAGRPDHDALDRIPGLLWRVDGRLREAAAPFALVDFEGIRSLPTRAWVAARGGVHQYESVRGCPFRCEFCDYPYLMGNKSFRMKSAEQIFEEWQALHALGVRHVDALDSLFTVPKKRAQRLAELLVASGLGRELTWACYARVKELADVSFTRLLHAAGCRYIFLGVESGSQVILDNMAKLTTVAQNAAAIAACNEVGLYTSSGILVGFPGETADSIAETGRFLTAQASPSVHIFVWIPDFTDDSPVPIMRPDRREKFAIGGQLAASTYPVRVWGEEVRFELRTQWRHATMTQRDALEHACGLSELIRSGAVDGEDFSFAPYRSLLLHPSRLAARMPFDHQRALVLGLADLYARYLRGVAPIELRAEVPRWLSASGLGATTPRRDAITLTSEVA